jgi:5'(3')-deoxyribonucleotidase
MKIAIDIDEVLGDFMPNFIKFYNDKYKTNLIIDDLPSYYLWNFLDVTRENMIQRVYDFHKTDYFKNIKPIKDAEESVKKLKENNELFIITSRQNAVIEETKQWIEKYFPNIFSEIYFTNNLSKNGESKTKKEICDLINADILIEDSLEYCLECMSPNRKIFLLDYSWNKNNNLPKEITRVYSWKEIMEKI